MNHQCNKEREIDLMWTDIKEIKSDVRDLLKFKWQIFGGSAVVSIIVVTIFQLVRHGL